MKYIITKDIPTSGRFIAITTLRGLEFTSEMYEVDETGHIWKYNPHMGEWLEEKHTMLSNCEFVVLSKGE